MLIWLTFISVASNLGDACEENIQCEMTFTSQAECRNNVCACVDGSHYEEEQRRCYESVGKKKKNFFRYVFLKEEKIWEKIIFWVILPPPGVIVTSPPCASSSYSASLPSATTSHSAPLLRFSLLRYGNHSNRITKNWDFFCFRNRKNVQDKLQLLRRGLRDILLQWILHLSFITPSK